MKLKKYIFTETGEVRPPKKDEWFITEGEVFIQSSTDFHTFNSPIYTREEITEDWKPKGDDIFYIIDGDMIVKKFKHSEISHYYGKCVDCGNCFKTREQAEQVRDKIFKVFKGEL